MTECRYDFIYATPDVRVERVEYLFDGNVKAASTRVFAGNNGATSNEPGFCHAKACPS